MAVRGHDQDTEELQDLRITLKDDELHQNFRLQRLWPSPYAGIALNLPKPEWGVDMTGADVALVVLRQIYSNFSSAYRDAHLQSPNAEGIRKEEANNALLLLAWQDFSPENANKQSFRRHVNVSSVIGNYNEKKITSFLEIMNSQKMKQTIWQRRALLLYNKTVGHQKVGQGDHWDYTELEDLAVAASMSIIRWTGYGDLGDIVSKRFGTFHDEDEDTDVFWSSNGPIIIRVLCKVGEDDLETTFDDLRTIVTRECRLVPANDAGRTWRHMHNCRPERRYNLIALVRCRDTTDELDRDVVKCWDVTGQVIVPLNKTSIDSSNFHFGKAGRTYSLYYAFSKSEPEIRQEYAAPAAAAPAMLRLQQNLLRATHGLDRDQLDLTSIQHRPQ
ncbi:hypothetical protein AB5N19_04317 [Seiridium cardinale]